METSLYELTESSIKLKNLIEDEKELTEYLDGVDMQIKDKAKDIFYVMKEYEGFEDNIDKEIKRLQGLKKSYGGNINRLKNYVEFNMQRSGIEKIETDLVTFALRKTPDRLTLEPDVIIPDKYLITKEVQTVDKMAMKKAIKGGEIIKGAYLESDKKLTIK